MAEDYYNPLSGNPFVITDTTDGETTYQSVEDYRIGEEGESGGYTPLTPNMYKGAQTVLGEKVPAYNPYLAGPVPAGEAPLSNPSFKATPNTQRIPRVDPKTGKIVGYDVTTYNWDGSVAGTKFEPLGAASATDPSKQSAFDAMILSLTNMGLASLIEPLRKIFESGITDADSLALALSQTPEYQTRFSANQARIKAGLKALSPAEYIGMEDAYQNLMRQYGLPASYYTPDSTGKQVGFDQLLGNDISATELEDRLIQAQQKVNNANPEVKQALQQFYGNSITNGDMLAYSLDPKNAINEIKRKVAAAEIGGAALAQGLGTSVGTAESLAGYGVNKQQAMQGYQAIAGILPTAQQLSNIYANQGVGPYTQATAEADIFGTQGSTDAERLRKKLAQLEQAQFSGQSGTAGSGALSRDRAITNYQLGMSGSGQF